MITFFLQIWLQQYVDTYHKLWGKEKVRFLVITSANLQLIHCHQVNSIIMILSNFSLILFFFYYFLRKFYRNWRSAPYHTRTVIFRTHGSWRSKRIRRGSSHNQLEWGSPGKNKLELYICIFFVKMKITVIILIVYIYFIYIFVFLAGPTWLQITRPVESISRRLPIRFCITGRNHAFEK